MHEYFFLFFSFFWLILSSLTPSPSAASLPSSFPIATLHLSSLPLPQAPYHILHDSKIIAFNHVFHHHATPLTRFLTIDSLLVLSPFLTIIGITDFLGLHLFGLSYASSIAYVLY
ncbi:hypothetical protein COCNU_02G010650 [Cocos nucifera]|uniref:Uncharacterized protein n=1 Tax=Cocos nucifera TaxID=13894 RepID=A0A8K0HZZ3_COCNU|nr:hypothetical protein COCNU_02G010650 [Cocos nucifera]